MFQESGAGAVPVRIAGSWEATANMERPALPTIPTFKLKHYVATSEYTKLTQKCAWGIMATCHIFQRKRATAQLSHSNKNLKTITAPSLEGRASQSGWCPHHPPWCSPPPRCEFAAETENIEKMTQAFNTTPVPCLRIPWKIHANRLVANARLGRRLHYQPHKRATKINQKNPLARPIEGTSTGRMTYHSLQKWRLYFRTKQIARLTLSMWTTSFKCINRLRSECVWWPCLFDQRFRPAHLPGFSACFKRHAHWRDFFTKQSTLMSKEMPSRTSVSFADKPCHRGQLHVFVRNAEEVAMGSPSR